MVLPLTLALNDSLADLPWSLVDDTRTSLYNGSTRCLSMMCIEGMRGSVSPENLPIFAFHHRWAAPFSFIKSILTVYRVFTSFNKLFVLIACDAQYSSSPQNGRSLSFRIPDDFQVLNSWLVDPLLLPSTTKVRELQNAIERTGRNGLIAQENSACRAESNGSWLNF